MGDNALFRLLAVIFATTIGFYALAIVYTSLSVAIHFL